MNTLAVIILYQPNETDLEKTIVSLIKQKVHIVLIDNGCSNDIFVKKIQNTNSHIEYLCMTQNQGIAYAQNIGINIGLSRKYDFIILFDQDSKIPNNLVSTLIKTYDVLQKQGEKIAAVGPSFYDLRYKNKLLRNKNIAQITQKKTAIIASGMLIPVAIFEQVGLMDELLFIDFVDIEWCHRASKKGFAVFQSSEARMEHAIGQIKYLAGKYIAMQYHTPIRYYYFFRNFIYLVRTNRLSKKTIFKSLIKDLPERLIKSLILKGRVNYYRNIFRGIIDGISLNKRKTP